MFEPLTLSAGAVLRPVQPGDAPALLDAYLRNREHLRPFDPARPDSFWTLPGQQRRLEGILARQREGAELACAMLRGGRVVGCATLTNIVHGAFRSAHLGYWVDVGSLRQGLASSAVAALCDIADRHLGLHRIEAAVLLGNVASRIVLTRTGFEQIGVARDYLHIDGRWQDMRLFQRILNDRPA